MPATSQLDWLISMTAMIVLFWVQGDEGPAQVVRLGHRGTPSLHAATKLPFLAARPIASFGPALAKALLPEGMPERSAGRRTKRRPSRECQRSAARASQRPFLLKRDRRF